MKQDNISISGLYYNYKKRSDDDIRNFLSKVFIVRKDEKGIGTVYGYYPLSAESMEKILKKPRNVSLTFDAWETSAHPLLGLTEYKTITYLVKSTSRFFLKPDIGEIIDQLDFHDYYDGEIKAICFNEGYNTLPDTDGEHHLMTATLLK